MDKHVQKVSLDNMNLRSHREQNHQQEKSKKRNPVYIGTSLKDTFGKDNDKCIEEAEKKERDKVKRNRINNKHRESSLKQPRIKYISNDLTLDALRKNDSLDDRSQQLPNHKSPKNYKAWKLKPADKGGGIGERGWIDKWSRFLQAVT
uniref:Endonuclease polyadenylation factor n=1 Tax=Musca domestica TaxID=7370 RepID=T1PPD4_MUSDO